MNTDRIDLIRAIETAQAKLDLLKSGVQPSYVLTDAGQAESAERYSHYVRQIVEITGDLRFEAVKIAADLGNGAINETYRADIRDCDLINDILTDVEGWAEEAREGEAA